MTLTQADVVAQTLKQQGIDVVFGLPGGENVPMVAAMDRAGIRFVMVHHESRAVWAADAYARIGRRLGVCLSTLGPGAANLAAGLAHAYLDRSPILAITAQLPAEIIGQHSHQRLDLHSIFSPVTKANYVISDMSDAKALIQQAMITAFAGRKGPVHIQISSPTSMKTATLFTDNGSEQSISSVKSVSEKDIEYAVSLVHSAKQPALLVGLDIEPAAPYGLLLQLAEVLQAPVIVTPKAKGAIPESHPLYAGVLGLERKEFAADTLWKADLILGVGFDPVELMVPWSFNAPFIHMSSAPNADPKIKAETILVGNLRSILQCLSDRIQSGSTRERTRWHAAYPIAGYNLLPEKSGGSGFIPSRLIQAARELLPDNGIATVDVGAHKLLFGKLWPARCPNRFLLSNGLSTMGYAVPAAIGAKLVQPDLPVVSFTGDGGFGMVDSELETAVRLKLPIVVVVMADEAMSLIRLKQVASGNKTIGTVMGPTDWVKVAQGFGAKGFAVEDVESFRKVFTEALQGSCPVLIEARIDPAEYQSF